MHDFDTTSHALSEILQDVPDKSGNIFDAFPQGRDHDRENVEAVEEIFAELAVFHHGFEVPARCGNHTDIYLDGPWTAEPFEFALLQNPQEFRLDFAGEFADFVQKDRRLVCEFEPANFPRESSVYAPFSRPKSSLSMIVAGSARTVGLYHGAPAALAHLVNGSGDELFACPSFAENQNG